MTRIANIDNQASTMGPAVDNAAVATQSYPALPAHIKERFTFIKVSAERVAKFREQRAV